MENNIYTPNNNNYDQPQSKNWTFLYKKRVYIKETFKNKSKQTDENALYFPRFSTIYFFDTMEQWT